MKSTIRSLLFSTVLCSYSCTDKHQNDELAVKYDKYLWLEDNTYETLMDNGLRCFKLNSIGLLEDSCIRLWNDEAYHPDKSKTHYLNMFEFGMGSKLKKPYAIYYNLEWQVKTGETPQATVTGVQKIPLQSKSGWVSLKRQMEELQLNRIDTIPLQRESDDYTAGDLLALQYVYGKTTITVDFSTHAKLLDSKAKKVIKYCELIRLIKDEFLVNLFLDHSGYNRFKSYSK